MLLHPLKEGVNVFPNVLATVLLDNFLERRSVVTAIGRNFARRGSFQQPFNTFKVVLIAVSRPDPLGDNL